MIGANEPPIFSPFRIVITFVSLTQNFFKKTIPITEIVTTSGCVGTS